MSPSVESHVVDEVLLIEWNEKRDYYKSKFQDKLVIRTIITPFRRKKIIHFKLLTNSRVR